MCLCVSRLVRTSNSVTVRRTQKRHRHLKQINHTNERERFIGVEESVKGCETGDRVPRQTDSISAFMLTMPGSSSHKFH